MTLSKRNRRTARKLVLPLIALAMMTTMMFMEAHARASTSAPAAASGNVHCTSSP